MTKKLSDDLGSRVFGLQIDGLSTRFYYRKSPFPTTGYVDKNCMTSISGYSARLEPSGGIAQYSPITVTLAVDPKATDSSEPGIIFSRTSRSKNVWQGQLLRDISRDEVTPTIVVDREPKINGVQIPTPHDFYIGGETFTVTTITAVGDGSWSLVTSARAGLRQLHQIRLGGTDTPIISSEIVNFRGRLCKIYGGAVDVHGRVQDKLLIYTGFIESSPNFSDSTSVSISIVPLVAMLDNKITTNNNTVRLVRDGHYFDRAKYFEVTPTQSNPDTGLGEIPFQSVASQVATGSGFKTHQEVIDAINLAGSGSVIPFSLSFMDGYSLSVRNGAVLGNLGYRLEQLLFYELFELRDRFYRETGRPYGWNSAGTLLFKSDGTVDLVYFSDEGVLFTAFDFTAQGSTTYEKDISEAPYFGEDKRKLYGVTNPTADDRISIFQCQGIPRAFRLKDEPFLLVDSTMDLPTTPTSGVSYPIQVKLGDKIFYPKVTHEVAETFGVILYLDMDDLETRAMPPIYEYTDRVEITRGFSIPSTDAGSAMLQLLQSGGGQSINGAFDLQLTGCNLPSTAIDTSSFQRLAYSTNISQWQMNFDIGDLTVRDVIEPMLKAMGCCIVMQNGLITLISMGSEYDSGTLTTINDIDILVDPPPLSTNFEDIITQYVFKYDFRRSDPTEAIFNNYDAINRLNGETSRMELSLYGLTSEIIGGVTRAEIYPFLRPTLARLFKLFSQPVRKWTFSVGSGKSLLLDLGSLVKINSQYLRGYDDTMGVSSAIAMITSIDVKLMEEGASLELLHYEDQGTVYNASAKVSSIYSLSALDFNQNTFSTQGDLSFFRVGDIVTLQSTISDTSATKTIQSIIGNRVFFTTNHGVLSTNTTMVPTTYDSASDLHKARGYIADSGGLGASGVDAYKYQ